MTSEILKARFKKFAIETALLIRDLPKNVINNAYCNQLIRSSSSAGANYRAACRAKSSADFINKLKIVEEELDESIFFIELLKEFNESFRERMDHLISEAEELLSIIVTTIITMKLKSGSKS